MAVLDRTKYDVELDGQGFRIFSLSKDSAPNFAPRFNTGADTESDLDLLRSTSIKDFAGGMMQRENFDDPQMVSTIIGGVFSPVNNYLYPHPWVSHYDEVTNADDGNLDDNYIVAEYEGVHYPLVKYEVSASATTSYFSSTNATVISSGGSGIWGTCTASLVGATTLNDACTIGSDLYISFNGGVDTWDGSTWSNYSAKTGLLFLEQLNGTLYGVGNGSGLWQDDGAGTFTRLGFFSKGEYPLFLVNYQNRLYCGTDQGLYAYDGIDFYPVLNGDFGRAIEYHGWLYLVKYSLGYNVLCRFNSVTFEVIQDFGEQYYIPGNMIVAHDRLFFPIAVDTEHQDGKWADVSVTNYGIMCWDDVAFTIVHEWDASDGNIPKLLWNDGNAWSMITAVDTNNKIWVTDYENSWFMTMSDSVGSINEPLDIRTSPFDGGFPNVPKTLHRIELDFREFDDTYLEYDSTIYVAYTDEYGQWTDFISVGTTSAITDRVLELETPIEFYKMQIKVVTPGYVNGVTTGNTQLKRISWRWTLHPQQRNRWHAGLICVGTDDYSAQEEKDGTELTATPKSLREAIYSAVRSNTPVWFAETDYTLLNGAINDSVTTITVDDTSMFDDSGMVRVGAEIIRYTGKTATTLTGCTRGAYGTSAGSHSDNAQIEPIYRVYATRIVQERYLLDDNTTNAKEADVNGMESEVLVELIEV